MLNIAEITLILKAEKNVKTHILAYGFLSHKCIPLQQFGFQASHSIIQQTHRLSHEITELCTTKNIVYRYF